ncbi:hypothetical protein PVAP13_3KG520600 [Panicum virgatum]|uniref:Uncharacterized protein n=1 Tax=Panicum virgatum TaxID=38727 RepID=A0A8T0VB49_PANVG|nr:hypothetical protein PVAP13_3KG520600 [Panicum virgatum]
MEVQLLPSTEGWRVNGGLATIHHAYPSHRVPYLPPPYVGYRIPNMQDASNIQAQGYAANGAYGAYGTYGGYGYGSYQ